MYLRTCLILTALLASACSETSRQAFTPRSAARDPDPMAMTPNGSQAREQRLQDAIDRAIHLQEILNEPVRMQGDDDLLVTQ